MKFRLSCIIILLSLTACTTNSSNSHPPYVNANTFTQINDIGALKQRIILLGDAGLSNITPLQASLEKAVERAKLSPDKTSVILLGDNIYPSGFPNKEPQQKAFNTKQLKHIAYLEAQLQIAKQSRAEMFIVPGNHDWYATQVDSQASYIENYAIEHQLTAQFIPYQVNELPLPQMVNRNGISLVFIDSMWLLKTNEENFQKAIHHLNSLLKSSVEQFPDNIILLAAHHPMETMGPHGGYYSRFGHQTYEAIVQLFSPNHQDISSEKYQKLIKHIKTTISPYQRTIFAAGHDHSLQVFKDDTQSIPRYNLVSGAANTKKLTGVSHNKNTEFALSQEGFIEIDVLDNGAVLKVFDIKHTNPVHQQWLWQTVKN